MRLYDPVRRRQVALSRCQVLEEVQEGWQAVLPPEGSWFAWRPWQGVSRPLDGVLDPEVRRSLEAAIARHEVTERVLERCGLLKELGSIPEEPEAVSEQGLAHAQREVSARYGDTAVTVASIKALREHRPEVVAHALLTIDQPMDELEEALVRTAQIVDLSDPEPDEALVEDDDEYLDDVSYEDLDFDELG